MTVPSAVFSENNNSSQECIDNTSTIYRQNNMTKILHIIDTIRHPKDPSFVYLPCILFVIVLALYEFTKFSESFRIWFKKILPIDDFTIPFKFAMFAIVLYCFFLHTTFGIVLFIIMVAYLQCEGMLDEWSITKNRNYHAKQNLKSMKQIRNLIAQINANETKPQSPIPKRIIQVWFDKSKTTRDKTNKYPKKFDKHVKSIMLANPGYEYMFFDKTQAEAFLIKHYPQYYQTYLRLPIFIQKIDFFRYIAVYHYGGFYMDLDVQALKPLDAQITNHKAVFPVDEYVVAEWQTDKRFRRFHQNGVDFLLGQYAFGAISGHGFLKRLIETIHKNIDAYERLVHKGEQYVYSTTGPDFVADEYMDYAEKEDIFILDNGKRQMFGDYAKHDYMGTWK